MLVSLGSSIRHLAILNMHDAMSHIFSCVTLNDIGHPALVPSTLSLHSQVFSNMMDLPYAEHLIIGAVVDDEYSSPLKHWFVSSDLRNDFP